MKVIALAAAAALAACAASAAQANTVDGTISPGEYAGATLTHTPYSPGADTSLATFGSGNELVSENIYFGADSTRSGFDIAVQTTPAGAGMDMADQSLGLQFTNLYFGSPGTNIVFELGNRDAVNVLTGARYDYSNANLGIQYQDTPGSSYANGGQGSVSEAYIPYAAYEAVAAQLGITVGTGSAITLRDVQAFSYAGNNGSPAGSRFGTVVISDAAVAAAPEPGTWALLLGGIGMLGALMRIGKARRDEDAVSEIATA